VALGALTLAIAMWTVVPPPTLALLALAVIVPELAPWCAAVCVVVTLVVYALALGRARTIAVACAIVALACVLVPLVEYPSARAAARAESDTQIGEPRDAPVERAASTIDVLRDRPVVTRDGTRLGLDVYRTRGSGARPAIVTIYGGAWIFGTRAQMASIDVAYARLGYTVVGIDYRHAPAHRFPVELHDVEDALATISKHAAAWNVDPKRVALFGRSAGAELALLAGYEPGPLEIRAVVAYYAPVDLVAGYDDPPAPDPANVRRILVTYLGGTPNALPAAYRRASPLTFVRPGLPPTFFICGRRDQLVRIAFQRTMRDALRAHGDHVTAIELPWSDHAFDAIENGLGASIATPATRAFLAATL